jgi:hypothetical protein
MAEMTIKRFGVISVAKMYSLLSFIIGLIFGVIYGLLLIIFGAAMTAVAPSNEGTAGGVSTVVMGIGIIIGVPLIYAVMGFISGAIGALIYNGVAGIMGGVQLELEGAHGDYAPPPPPQHWVPHQYPAQ